MQIDWHSSIANLHSYPNTTLSLVVHTLLIQFFPSNDSRPPSAAILAGWPRIEWQFHFTGEEPEAFLTRGGWRSRNEQGRKIQSSKGIYFHKELAIYQRIKEPGTRSINDHSFATPHHSNTHTSCLFYWIQNYEKYICLRYIHFLSNICTEYEWREQSILSERN